MERKRIQIKKSRLRNININFNNWDNTNKKNYITNCWGYKFRRLQFKK